MVCITLFAQPMAMATTQFARAIPHQTALRQTKAGVVRNTLRMSWVVVTDNDGKKNLRIEWQTGRDADGPVF
jgi:hypothetical protein